MRAKLQGIVLCVSWLCAQQGSATFLPPTVLGKPASAFADFDEPRVTEVSFNYLIKALEEVYEPIVKAHGATLKIFSHWEDDTLNAFAEQSLDEEGGLVFELHLFGGLARRSEVDINGYALVACHEIGHHLAGFPFYGDGEWGSSEGESDYYATQVCAKEIWKSEPFANAVFGEGVHPSAKLRCDAVYENPDERNLCYRSATGGLQLGRLLESLTGEEINPEGLDTDVVAETNPYHPFPQCRLDTYVAGALCKAGYKLDLIPGRDEQGGTSNGILAEFEAATVSCMDVSLYADGFRPRCWFAPYSEQKPSQQDSDSSQQTQEPAGGQAQGSEFL